MNGEQIEAMRAWENLESAWLAVGFLRKNCKYARVNDLQDYLCQTQCADLEPFFLNELIEWYKRNLAGTGSYPKLSVEWDNNRESIDDYPTHSEISTMISGWFLYN